MEHGRKKSRGTYRLLGGLAMEELQEAVNRLPRGQIQLVRKGTLYRSGYREGTSMFSENSSGKGKGEEAGQGKQTGNDNHTEDALCAMK